MGKPDPSAQLIALERALSQKSEPPHRLAQALRAVKAESGLAWRQIERMLRISRTYRKLLLSILSLPPEMASRISWGRPGKVSGAGKLTLKHARALYLLRERPIEQRAVFRRLLIRGESGNAVLRKVEGRPKGKQNQDASRDPNIQAAREKLVRRLGTRVEIEPRVWGGRVVIEYYSSEDLERLYEILQGQG